MISDNSKMLSLRDFQYALWKVPMVDYVSQFGADQYLRLAKLLVLCRIISFLDSNVIKLGSFHREEILIFSIADSTTPVQVHSLNILAWFISETSISDEKQLLLAVVGCIVALASTLKSVPCGALKQSSRKVKS
ncbi:hypothetical protein SELMODRAFT_431870 [Selaginella moellendorffii]|uniref:Uncharacterized protein n=1 Tax=Selaginella moellendorffii TaxID=88036 RepID=D8TE16_SELML|nr:hypothetical protein SELMODRAFT_431870 [Selaginella moellendorffii]